MIDYEKYTEETVSFYIQKPLWQTSIGDLTVVHTYPLSLWQRIGLRFLGWKVEKINE